MLKYGSYSKKIYTTTVIKYLFRNFALYIIIYIQWVFVIYLVTLHSQIQKT